MSIRVGDLRPSQILFSFGVGSIVDLPNISAMVMGLDEWDVTQMQAKVISEERLLAAVKSHLGSQVGHLYHPPIPDQDDEGQLNPLSESSRIGIPVITFPKWMRCLYCHILAPLDSNLFRLKTDPYRVDKTCYVHVNCPKSQSAPAVLPVRFIVACERGHLDDFPWNDFIHQGQPCLRPSLKLREWGVSGSIIEIMASCDNCSAKKVMKYAFGEDAAQHMPRCKGRRPHLRDFDPTPCDKETKAMLLGASNSWFPLTLSVLHIPRMTDELGQLVDEWWGILELVTSAEVLSAFRKSGQIRAFGKYSEADIWKAIQQKRNLPKESKPEAQNLKEPEWASFTNPDPGRNSLDFHLTLTKSPKRFEKFIEKVVLVERLREVRALVGFTRIESPGDFESMEAIPEDQWAPLSRHDPLWVPAAEVRGEGLFIQFKESVIAKWCSAVSDLESAFFEAHRRWRQMRNIPNPEAAFPGIRYILLHSFSHALMRQIALECGYAQASIRERIYSQEAGTNKKAMAGILLYTSAADSEGTLGGLVNIGDPDNLGRHFEQALEQARVCSSDPLCAEHHPSLAKRSLHGAACHACSFSPETSCEQGNKYLDRRTLVSTFDKVAQPFFD